jgi:hypothetical protein
VFANSRWEVFLQAIGQPLATAERKATWKSSKNLIASGQLLMGVGKLLGNAKITPISE